MALEDHIRSLRTSGATFVMDSNQHPPHTAQLAANLPSAVSLFEQEQSSMPRYHFDLVDSRTVADEGGQWLPDNDTAQRVAKQIAQRLWDDRPQLRNRSFAILVTDEDGERVAWVPIDPHH